MRTLALAWSWQATFSSVTSPLKDSVVVATYGDRRGPGCSAPGGANANGYPSFEGRDLLGDGSLPSGTSLQPVLGPCPKDLTQQIQA